MVQIHPSVAKQHISLNSRIHVFVKYFFWNKMEHEWISVILINFWGCFLKKCWWLEKIFDGFLVGFQKLDLHHWPRNEIRILKFRVWTVSCRPTGWRLLERFFCYCWMMNHALKKTGIRRVLWNPLKSLKSGCSQLTVMLRSVKRSHRKELSFCAKQSEVAESIGEPSNCHAARSETESQNLSFIKTSPQFP